MNPGSRPRWSMHPSWTTPQSDNRALLFLDNSGLSWTISAPDKVTAVPVRRNGNFQTPISVPAVRPKRCHILSNPAHRQDYMVARLNYTLQMMMPLPGWPAMAPNAYNNNNKNGITQSMLFICKKNFQDSVIVKCRENYETRIQKVTNCNVCNDVYYSNELLTNTDGLYLSAERKAKLRCVWCDLTTRWRAWWGYPQKSSSREQWLHIACRPSTCFCARCALRL